MYNLFKEVKYVKILLVTSSAGLNRITMPAILISLAIIQDGYSNIM